MRIYAIDVINFTEPKKKFPLNTFFWCLLKTEDQRKQRKEPICVSGLCLYISLISWPSKAENKKKKKRTSINKDSIGLKERDMYVMMM